MSLVDAGLALGVVSVLADAPAVFFLLALISALTLLGLVAGFVLLILIHFLIGAFANDP